MDANNTTHTDRSPHLKRPWKRALLKPREGVYKLWGLLLTVCLIFVGVVIAEHPIFYLRAFVIQLCVLPPFILILEILHRACLYMEERKYFPTRYNNDLKQFLYYFLYFSPTFITIFVIWIIIFCVYLIYDSNPFRQWHRFGMISNCCTFIGGLLFGKLMDLDAGRLRESLWISNSNGLDYGSGMAYSFFHGYLKLVIPKTGTSEPDIQHLMRVYENREHVRLESYKLFILIPKSMHCPPSLKNDESPSIEKSKSLFEKVIDVAGVKGRIYKNSIYKIRTNNNINQRYIYVAAEYATPLKTFREVFNNNSQHSETYQQHKDEIALQFYRTLQNILDRDPTVGPHCELIYYNDIHTLIGEREVRHDVGLVLLDRLKQIKKKNA